MKTACICKCDRNLNMRLLGFFVLEFDFQKEHDYWLSGTILIFCFFLR